MIAFQPDEPIGRAHDRESFDCGVEALNIYLARYARQNHESGSARTFVVPVAADLPQLVGYYSLSAASIQYDQTPSAIRKRLARHEVPLFRLARLAVDRRYQRSGVGGRLLARALVRCVAAAEHVGSLGLLIDAKDEGAADWYRRFGAESLPDRPLTLLLPFSTLQARLP